MITEIVVGLIAAGIYLITEGIFNFIRKKVGKLPNLYGPDSTYEPTEYDKQLIEFSRELIHKHFPNGIEKTMVQLSPKERVELFKNLAAEVADLYEIDVTSLEFLNSDKIGPTTAGFYDRETGKIAFNLDIISGSDPELLKLIVGTIFHESRHALQYKAITDENFKEFDDAKVIEWIKSFNMYIPAELDEYGYYYQPVEFDARNFALLVTFGL
jgi:hypothetical protein